MTSFVVASFAFAAGYELGFVSSLFSSLHVNLRIYSCPFFTVAPCDGVKTIREFARVFIRPAPYGSNASLGRRVCVKISEC